jgi:DNA-binding NtrC family response regulator
VIGTAAARGLANDQATLTEAVVTLAALGAPALRARLDALAAVRDSQTSMPEILGRSPAMVALRQAVARAAAAPFPILIEGESGTGKELVARAVHRLSSRRDRRFSAVNCAALGDDLIEAELFGHARGAFTGAVGPRPGLFEDAHGGTLMLDEVAELSARAQAKLLRVLQEREVRRLGENTARPVDVRVVAATNRPLGELTGHGLFREDLLFRLAVIRLRLPPLRERVEDIPLLAHAVWRDLIRQAGKRALLGPDAVAALCRHDWPGNVRELQNVVAALVVDAPARGRTGARVVAKVLDVSKSEREPAVVPLGHARTTCERQTVASALARHAGRRAPAARDLGLTRQGLAKAMRRLGLADPGDHAGVA